MIPNRLDEPDAMAATRASETVKWSKKYAFSQMHRATLAREARNRLNYWCEAAREARRLTPEISSRRIWYRFWKNMCPGVAGVGKLRSPE